MQQWRTWTMNTNNLSTTTYQKGTQAETGTQDLDTGADFLSSWVIRNKRTQPILNQPELLPVTLTQRELILIDTVMRATSEALQELKDNKEIDVLTHQLEKIITNLNITLQHSPKEKIVKSLQLLGDTFQCEMPKDDGLYYYIEAIKDIPPIYMREAIVNVMKTHKYNFFPLPATIRESVDKKLDFCQTFLRWCEVAWQRLTSLKQ